MVKINGIVFVMLFLATRFAFSFQATYEGVKRCKNCHMKQKAGMVYEKWEASEHAHAFDVLNESERKNPFCLKCHVTSYNEPSSPGIEFDDLLGVQCEECHGPGSLYKKIEIMNQREKSIEAGLIVPTEETCKRCHNKESPHYKPFIFRITYPKIRHQYRSARD